MILFKLELSETVDPQFKLWSFIAKNKHKHIGAMGPNSPMTLRKILIKKLFAYIENEITPS